jgi:hypothetical protein
MRRSSEFASLAVLAFASHVQAQTLVQVNAPDGGECPSPQVFQAAIERRTPAGAAPVRVQIEFHTAAAPNDSTVQARVTMRTMDDSNTLLERDLSASRCAELLEPIALVVGIARGTMIEPIKPAPPVPAPPVEAPVPSEPKPLESPEPIRSLRGAFAIGPRMYNGGALPAYAFAVGVDASIKPWSRAFVAASISLAPGATADNPLAQGSYVAFDASACWELVGVDARASVAPCLGASLGALTLRTTQGPAVSGTNLVVAGLASLRAEFVPIAPLVLVARLGVSASPARYQIGACNEDYFSSKNIGLDSFLGVGLRFR